MSENLPATSKKPPALNLTQGESPKREAHPANNFALISAFPSPKGEGVGGEV